MTALLNRSAQPAGDYAEPTLGRVTSLPSPRGLLAGARAPDTARGYVAVFAFG
ncbi:hypothetical protein F5X71_18435 [Nocardia brasiliensis]|uniref:Uncharacterized protein n=1 Tax=Nocardia brasiliensis TaxID=37326 RepID=A0A6G9XT61_NOCBR|nr:hypothetical protein [Nocardia brasiliensis]QIS04040.1 hypothetical protein F5X71_18435 [Nocardia brasiliensis]